MKYNSVKKILILLAILALPGILYYLLQQTGKNRYKNLPFLGSKVISSTFRNVRGKQIPDTVYHALDDFSLVNQKGDKVNLASFKAKIVVANLFYTGSTSQGIFTGLSEMEKLANAYAKNKMLHFVSITIDPENDTPEKLAAFAEKMQINAHKWELLSGDVTQINNLIKKGMLLDAIKENVKGKPVFTFSNKFVLMDSHQRIRGIYEAVNKDAMSKLGDEIKVLLAEELRNIKDGR